MSHYDLIMQAIQAGDLPALEAFERSVAGFPDGCDDFIRRRWITNAVDCGPLVVLRWMIERGVELRFADAEGFPILHSAIDRALPDRLVILELLILAGADLDASGINGWTPAHLAAARNDIEALELLIAAGADLERRTRIDDDATPLEEARMLDCNDEIIAALERPEAIRSMRKFRALRAALRRAAVQRGAGP